MQLAAALRQSNVSDPHFQELVSRIAVLFDRRLIDLNEVQRLLVENPRRERIVVKDKLQALAAVQQRLMGPFAPGDVTHKARVHRRIGAAHARNRQFDGKLCAVFSQGGHFQPFAKDPALTAGPGAFEPSPMELAQRRRDDQLRHFTAQRLLAGEPERLDRRRIELNDFPIVVDRDDGIERGFENGALGRLALLKLLRSQLELEIPLLQFVHQPLVVFFYQVQFLRGTIRFRPAARRFLDRLAQGLNNFDRRRRFLEKLVGAQLQRGVFVGLRSIGAGVDDERDAAEFGALPKLETEAVTIHARHEDVGNHGVNFFSPLQHGERLHAVGGLDHLEPFGFQNSAERSAIV